MDILIPNDQRTAARLWVLLSKVQYTPHDDGFVVNATDAKRISDQLDDEGFDCDWGAISG